MHLHISEYKSIAYIIHSEHLPFTKVVSDYFSYGSLRINHGKVGQNKVGICFFQKINKFLEVSSIKTVIGIQYLDILAFCLSQSTVYTRTVITVLLINHPEYFRLFPFIFMPDNR